MTSPTRKAVHRFLAAPLLAAVLLLPLASPGGAEPYPADNGAGHAEKGGTEWDESPFPAPREVITSLAMNGRWGEAISLYRLTVLRGHLEKARWEEALRLLQRMEGSRDFPGGTGPREIRRQASLALEQDAATLCSAAFPADALPLSDLAVRFDPSRPDSWALRAFCRQRLGMEGGAESDYRKALSLDSRNFGAVLGLSRLLQDLGRGREATTLWTDFLSLEPRNAEGWLRRGESLLSERNEAGAARDLEDACALGSTEGCRRLDEVRRGLREAPRGAAPPGG